eukprot:26683_4
MGVMHNGRHVPLLLCTPSVHKSNGKVPQVYIKSTVNRYSARYCQKSGISEIFLSSKSPEKYFFQTRMLSPDLPRPTLANTLPSS